MRGHQWVCLWCNIPNAAFIWFHFRKLFFEGHLFLGAISEADFTENMDWSDTDWFKLILAKIKNWFGETGKAKNLHFLLFLSLKFGRLYIILTNIYSFSLEIQDLPVLSNHVKRSIYFKCGKSFIWYQFKVSPNVLWNEHGLYF